MTTIDQYCNRLVEWIPSENLAMAEGIFYDLIDKGIAPDRALKITVKLCML